MILTLLKAKWGDIGSISILLNDAFSSRGVSVSLNMRRDKVLGIALESESNDILDKQIAIEIICRSLNKIKTKAFNEAFVSINTSESNILFWTQNLIFKDNQFIEKEDIGVAKQKQVQAQKADGQWTNVFGGCMIIIVLALVLILIFGLRIVLLYSMFGLLIFISSWVNDAMKNSKR